MLPNDRWLMLWFLNADGSSCIWYFLYLWRQYAVGTLMVGLSMLPIFGWWKHVQDWFRFPYWGRLQTLLRKIRQPDLSEFICKKSCNWIRHQTHFTQKYLFDIFLCFVLLGPVTPNFIQINYYLTHTIIIKCHKIHYVDWVEHWYQFSLII